MRGAFWAACLIIAIALLGGTTTVSAAPAAPLDFPITQPDGSVFQARQWGDETRHGLETSDGYTILPAADGVWVYALPAGIAGEALAPARPDGQRLVVGRDLPGDLPRGLRPTTLFVPWFAEAPAEAPALAGLPDQPAINQVALGSQKLLVLLVSFPDEQIYYPLSQWQAAAFGSSGSVRDYFYDASYGQLRLDPAPEQNNIAGDGMVEVQLAYAHPNTRSTEGGGQVIRDALTAADADVDFTDFDANHDGLVTSAELHVLLIVAGFESAYNPADSPGLWAHMAGLYRMTYDGVTLQRSTAPGDYGVAALAGERHSADHRATLGVLVHELGHTLSFPDLYDYDGSSGGVGEWSVMGGGSWNHTALMGDAPAQPDAFLKWYAGWVTPTAMLPGQTASLRPSHKSAGAAILGENPGGVDWEFTHAAGIGEYWLVEYRAEPGLPGCGILIWHIDESADMHAPVQDESQPLMHIEQADGHSDLLKPLSRGDSGDPFPGITKNRLFDDTSLPSSVYHSGDPSNTRLTVNTALCGTSMSITLNVTDPQTLKFFLPAILH